MTQSKSSILPLTALVLGLLAFGSVQAGPHGHGWHRGGHWGHTHFHHHHRGSAHWVAPAIIGGALLATAISRPAYAQWPVAPVVLPPTVTYVQSHPASVTYVYPTAAPVVSVSQQPMGYYCATSGQFYPQVPTCSVPWQLI